MLAKTELPDCPVAITVQLIGSKWKLLIIRNLRMNPWRFNELQKDLAGISQKVLTDSLRGLGETMRPILDAMEQWGEGYKAMAEVKRPRPLKSKGRTHHQTPLPFSSL